MIVRSGCFLILMGCLALSACQDVIAPISDQAQLCIADTDCDDTFFCSDGRCLRPSGPRCGDGKLDPQEACDDGNRDDADGCVVCQVARCGDGAVQLGIEGCDAGDDANSDEVADACRTDCQLARCGDGTIDSGEACDDGDQNAAGVPDRCRVNCVLPACGDGVVDRGEDCDDTNAIETDACSSSCQAARCGDGVVRTDVVDGEPGFEYCDDGNLDDEDGCDRWCGQGILSADGGSQSTCVAKHNGEVWCWGLHDNLEGLHWTLRPQRINVPGRVVELHGSSVGRTDEGKVFTWSGQTGLVDQINLGEHRATRLIMRNPRWDRHPLHWRNGYICTAGGKVLRGGFYRGVWGTGQVAHGPDEATIDCDVVEHNVYNAQGNFTGTEATYCSLTASRQLYCWGSNRYGMTGNGETTPVEQPYRLPIDGVRAFDVVVRKVCALDRDYDLHCWGQTSDGVVVRPLRLQGVPKLGRMRPAWRVDTGAWVPTIDFDSEGNGDFDLSPRSVAYIYYYGDRSEIRRPRYFSNPHTTFVVDETYRLWVRGSDSKGRAGVGKAWRYEPVRVEGLESSSSLALGTYFACARGALDGDVSCWGGSWDGRGVGTYRGTNQSVRASDPPTWAGESLALDVGGVHACRIETDRSVRCWGHGRDRAQVIRLDQDWAPDQISVGGSGSASCDHCSINGHQCVLNRGVALCWGDNARGQTGQGDDPNNPPILAPAVVMGLPPLTSLSLGGAHSCALDENQAVWCWGDNEYGQLGHADTLVGYVPTRVDLPFAVAQISAGEQHTCVRAQAGTVHCWGGIENATGVESINLETPRNPGFLAIPGIEDAIDISSGLDYACAVLGRSAEVVCWAGQPNFVTGSRIYEGVAPRTIPGLPPIQKVKAARHYACALSEAGEAWCWGSNHSNQLGDDYHGVSLGAWTPVDRFEQEWSDRE